MKVIQLPPTLERPALLEICNEELVELVLRQQEIISQLVAEVERLQANANSNYRSSSKPPSDIHKHLEKQKPASDEPEPGKRKPGGQPKGPHLFRLPEPEYLLKN